MSSQLGYSEFMSDNDNNDQPNKKRRNKTIKKKAKPSKKAVEFLNSMDIFKGEDEDEDDLADFNPPPNPQLTSLPIDKKEDDVDSDLSPEAFNNINVSEEKIKQYYNNYIPYYENTEMAEINMPFNYGPSEEERIRAGEEVNLPSYYTKSDVAIESNIKEGKRLYYLG